jgi:type II secretory pathway component PulM
VTFIESINPQNGGTFVEFNSVVFLNFSAWLETLNQRNTKNLALKKVPPFWGLGGK